MSASSLSRAELDRWAAWKQAYDTVTRAVETEIATASGLSSPDFSVLTRLVELGDGTLRQQELADLLGWKRARLSRQLSRMAERGLLEREADGAARRVRISEAGRDAVARARPAHARAVRRALLQRADAATFWRVLDGLGSE